MAWRDWPNWLRGGIVASVIDIIMISIIIIPHNMYWLEIPAITYSYLPLVPLYRLGISGFVKDPGLLGLTALGVAFSIISWFILASIVCHIAGLIISKIKSKK
jgi:hypothetical protein